MLVQTLLTVLTDSGAWQAGGAELLTGEWTPWCWEKQADRDHSEVVDLANWAIWQWVAEEQGFVCLLLSGWEQVCTTQTNTYMLTETDTGHKGRGKKTQETQGIPEGDWLAQNHSLLNVALHKNHPNEFQAARYAGFEFVKSTGIGSLAYLYWIWCQEKKKLN